MNITHNYPLPVATIEQVCAWTGLSRNTIFHKIQAGEIPVMPKKGKETVFINLEKWRQMALEQPY